METTKEAFTVQTPEHVGFQYVTAGLGSRAAAFFLDTVIRALFVLAIFVLVSLFSRWLPRLDPTGLMEGGPVSWVAALGVLAYGVIDLGYFLFFEAFWSGQTPGKRVQKLRVIRRDGQPIGLLESSIRNILRAVDMVAGVYPLGLFVMFFSRTNQRIGDYAAGTVVIVERRQQVPGVRTRLRSESAAEESGMELHVSQLTPRQYQVLSAFLQRRENMDPENRQQLAELLTQRLRKKWGLPTKGETSGEGFIEQVVTIYEQRKRAI